MKRPYITRKNIIAVSIAILYAALFIFVGLCLAATKGSAFSEQNAFRMLAIAFGMKIVTISGLTGYISLIITTLYIVVLTFAIIYVRRFQVVNRIPWKNWKLILAYVVTVVATTLIPVALTFLLGMNDKESAKLMFTLYGECIAITTLVGIILGAVVFAICALIVNFKKVNEPYDFFNEENYDDLGNLEEEKDASVMNSFDVPEESTTLNLTANAAGPGGLPQPGAPVMADASAQELDDREKVFPGLSKIDVKYDGYSIENIPTDNISLEDLVERFRNYLAKEEHLYYDIDTLRIFISGLNATRLSILEGLSGTGKSSLPRYFAKFINAEVTFLPVQVSWRDKTSILGYFNDFSKIYNETDFLLKLYDASYNTDKIYIFVLDEMNISRVEYYFADFLSVLEYPSEQWKIRIMQLPYGFVPPAKLDDGFVTIPENSFFVGTANKDDSTFSIADKVYDRSTVIAFDNRNEPFEVKGESSPITLSYSKLKSLFEGALSNDANKMTKNDYEKLSKVTDYIYDQFEVTFGNRVLNQIDQMVPIFIASGGKKENALDFILARKVLIKLEGHFEEYVKPALKGILDKLDEVYGSKEFQLSRKQINSLLRKL